eukprot:1185829-Amorphochlora_amoeboformis.AAC.1
MEMGMNLYVDVAVYLDFRLDIFSSCRYVLGFQVTKRGQGWDRGGTLAEEIGKITVSCSALINVDEYI